MTDDTARHVANTVIGIAVAGAVYSVVSRPPLRRLAWGLVLAGLTSTLPAWLNREVRQAWAESGRPPG